MDLDFDGIPPVVDEEDDGIEPLSHHGRHVLQEDMRGN